jgi:hypothetical protein
MDGINRSKSDGSAAKKLYETPERTSQVDEAADRKKKIIVGGAAGGLTLLGVILIIVFATGAGGGGDNPHTPPGPPTPITPPPPPPVTPTFRHYNPYGVVGVPVNQGFSFSGQLKGTFPQVKQNAELSKNYKLLEQKDAADPPPPITSIGVDVSTIPLGVNN